MRAGLRLVNTKSTGCSRSLSASKRHELRAVDLELAAFVCVTSIEALTHTAVLHRSADFTDEVMSKLVDEATRLVVGYLQ